MEAVARRLAEPSFWNALAPGLHVDGSAPIPATSVDPEPAFAALRHEGYLHLDAVIPPDHVRTLLAAILRLRQADLPPVFVFAWDEAWTTFLALDRLWVAILGPEWRLLPAFFAWYVEPVEGASGWKPHQDRLGTVAPDGTPTSLSAWVPLTHATPDNGCIHVVPRPWQRRASWDIELQDVRALPARPGSVLAWNQELWHWSGRVGARAVHPRVSLSFELQRGDIAPLRSPLLGPGVPDLPERLRLIAEQILRYTHMTGVDERVIALAQALRS